MDTAATFGQENFGTAKLKNRSRTRRLVRLADQLLEHPEGTLPDKLPRRKDLKAFYRLMANPATTHDSLLAPHRDLVRQRMATAGGTILLVHDTTELDFSGLLSVPDLGQLGNGKTRGLLCHNSLAVGGHDRRVLGLANQILLRRPHVPKKESRQDKRARQDRESRLWQRAAAAIGDAPVGQRHVDVCDRGADVFEFLEFEHRHGRAYVVRATHDRATTRADADPSVTAPSAQPGPLFTLARSLPARGHKTVAVAARPGQSARTARVRLAGAAIVLHAPKHARGAHGQESLPLWVVYVGEEDAPQGREPVEWVLLTNVAVHSDQDVRERVDWYEARWLAEEFHKSQKTGCGIERLQLSKQNHDERGRAYKNRLEPAIAVLSVVAVQLLILRDWSRDESLGGRPATEVFAEEEVKVLGGWHYEDGRRLRTVGEFCEALAALGGHQGRKGDGMPGWQTLWRGWQKLHLMVQGARAARAADAGRMHLTTATPGADSDDLESG